MEPTGPSGGRLGVLLRAPARLLAGRLASLRARVLASVLLLSAAGLVALAAVTYAEQRSFLEGRVDEQARSAAPGMSRALDFEGFVAPGSSTPTGTFSPFGPAPSNDGSRNRGLQPNLPTGTYGERQSASGKVIGEPIVVRFSQSEARRFPKPQIPANAPVGKLLTVGAKGSSMHYRVFATRDPDDSGITVVAVPLHDVEQTLSRLLLVEGLVILGVLIALGLSAFFVVRLGLRPLNRMEVTAGQIAAGELSHRVSPATERTEVGRLGLALNRMLDRLEEAFQRRAQSEERLRRFLADASHELRTPLASIRGYAELFRMGATASTQDTELAMRRIEEESTRMGVLVDDLLTLARLDEEREPVREAVDLSALAADAVHDARATAPDREIGLDAQPAAVLGDAHQLRQVLANLMRNALLHTPAGTPVEVSLAADGGQSVLTVRDHGPGLPPGVGSVLFERFWRAEGGRERGRGGAGLGLAIVREVVEAHGGSIAAENALEGGARFVVRLPSLAAS
ncbi:MAG TPA: HAMP domain-containing sensor histidine kinase [Solirubrobacteraceae bacterium]|nr:HAMP domain-containing sensor histidine kinase [Solirubrobacteraceae bacterium]